MTQTDLDPVAAAEDHRRRVRYLTTFYPWLQGLRFLPLGVLFTAASIWLVAVPGESSGRGVALAVLVPSIGGLVAQIPISAWYRRTFGSATMSPRNKKLVGLLVLLSALLGLLMGPAAASRPFPPPWYPPLIMSFTGAACAGFWWVTGKVAHHYLGLAAGSLAIAAPYAAGVSPFCAAASALHAPGMSNCTVASLLFYAGALIVPCALFDHRLLARTLARRGEEAG